MSCWLIFTKFPRFCDHKDDLGTPIMDVGNYIQPTRINYGHYLKTSAHSTEQDSVDVSGDLTILLPSVVPKVVVTQPEWQSCVH
jgi:hypothetical protein